MMFSVTFLGHQGWLFAGGSTTLLVDPLLTDNIGHGGVVGKVFPPRQIDFAAFPAVDAVFLTHEHEDHFDIPSLNLLARSIPILLSERSSIAARTVLKEMGFEVVLIAPGTKLAIGGLILYSFSPDHVTMNNGEEWDVLPFLVVDVAGHGSFFSSVDVYITTQVESRLKELLLSPGLICHTNNNMNWSFQKAGETIVRQPPRDTFQTAVDIISSEMRVRTFWGIPAGSVICGGGVSFDGSRSWLNNNVFFADSEKVCAALSALAPESRFFVPSPGGTLRMVAGKIQDVLAATEFLASRPRESWPSREWLNDVPLAGDYEPAAGQMELTDSEFLELQEYLGEFASHLYGKAAFRELFSLPDLALNGRRATLALVLLVDESRNTYTLRWEPRGCRFELVESADAAKEYVAGMELWATDLLALFRGSFGPTAVGFGRHRSWNYLPEELSDNGYGLFEFFHPLRRPQAFLRLYRTLYSSQIMNQPLIRRGSARLSLVEEPKISPNRPVSEPVP